MVQATSGTRVSITRLILIPSVIALAVTILRLVGELQQWSPAWFDKEGAGINLEGVKWIIGITWLALPFGVYFAIKLKSANQGPANIAKAISLAVVGAAIFVVGMRYVEPSINEDVDVRLRLLIIWAFGFVPAVIQLFGWPQLWKTLLAYGLASRIPVAVIMLLAMRGNWGTHYDYTGRTPQDNIGEFYFWFGLIPQLIFWIGFTILAGSLTGSIAAALFRRSKSAQSSEGAYTATS